jgi:hypothetical protein
MNMRPFAYRLDQVVHVYPVCACGCDTVLLVRMAEEGPEVVSTPEACAECGTLPTPAAVTVAADLAWTCSEPAEYARAADAAEYAGFLFAHRAEAPARW